jgi:hypothetical protein
MVSESDGDGVVMCRPDEVEIEAHPAVDQQPVVPVCVCVCVCVCVRVCMNSLYETDRRTDK